MVELQLSRKAAALRGWTGSSAGAAAEALAPCKRGTADAKQDRRGGRGAQTLPKGLSFPRAASQAAIASLPKAPAGFPRGIHSLPSHRPSATRITACHAARSAMLPAVPACSICWQVPRYHGNAVKVQITFPFIPISAAALFPPPPPQYFISHASAAEAARKGLGCCSAIRAVVTLHEVLAQE